MSEKKKFAKFKNLLLKYVAIPAVLIAGKNCTPSKTDTVHKKVIPTEDVRSIKVANKHVDVKSATKEIVFQTDTLDTPPSALMYHVNNEIIRNFVPGNSSYSLALSILAHEQKHKDNYNKKLRRQKLTPMQYAKMCMHDEISANICELLTLRYEYLAAETPEAKSAVIQKYEKGRFGYYFQAVDKGQISPEKKDAKSRRDEWAFIAQGTQKMWMERLAPVYLPGITRMVERYLDRYSPNTPKIQTDCGYSNVLKIAYNIGGVDFGKYMESDIEISDETLALVQQVSEIDIGKGNKKEYFQRIKSNMNKLKQKGYPLSKKVISHLYLAEGMKIALKGIDKEVLLQHPYVITACYSKMCQQISKSKETKDLFKMTVSDNQLQKVETPVSKEVLAEIYMHKDINLSDAVLGFNPMLIETGLFWNAVPVSDIFLQQELENMRNCSVSDKSDGNASTQTTKPRRSEKMSFLAPDFSQPILVAATAQQEQEIMAAINSFNEIPKVMRGCDLEAQAAYLKTQKQR